MPAYEIEHIDTLTSLQKDKLAKAITEIHSRLFTTPSLFVNVHFVNLDGQDYYVGGRKVGDSFFYGAKRGNSDVV